MVSRTGSSVKSGRTDPLEEVRRLNHVAVTLAAHHDRARHLEALKSLLAFAESHRPALAEAASEMATLLDDAAMAFYRASSADLAHRAVDLGLEFAPGSSILLHHKALILLAQNQGLEEVISLLDKALEANPHDKAVWATRGDALKLQNQSKEAASAYLHAQQLDATSTQYVDKALKLVPNDPVALRMKLQLAKAHGGDRQALAAVDVLLGESPDDPELLMARAEILASLGQLAEALEPLAKARASRPDDPRMALHHARLLIMLDRLDEVQPILAAAVPEAPPAESATLAELAGLLEEQHPELALPLRQRVAATDPRNLGNLSALRSLAIRLDQVDVGLEACRAILETYPENLEAMRGVADFLLVAGKNDEALQAYRALVKAHPHDIAEHRRALEAAKAAGNSDLVREFAQAILANDPTDSAAQIELARVLMKAGEKQEALAVYDSLIQNHPGQIDYLMEKKELTGELNDPEQLRPVLDELFRLDPTRTDLALERGNLYLALAYDRPEGSVERDTAARTALVSYERSSMDPESAAISQLGIARASRLVQDHDRAVQAYRDFLTGPGNEQRTDVLKELGHALRETGRLTEAHEVYDKAIQLGLEDPDLFWGELEVLSQLNQEAGALRYVELLLQREPQNPLFLRRKGQLLLKTGRRTEALDVLKAAVQSAHGDPHSYFEVAEALRDQGAYADAIAYFRQGLGVDPKSGPGRLALAETLLLAGQYHEVIPIVDQLLKEDPNELAAWKARGDAYRGLGRPSELLYSLTAILLLDPHNAPALLEKFRLHEAAGEKQAAFDALSQLLAANGPDAHDAALQLERGDLASALGHVEEANESYEKAAQLDPTHLVEIAGRRARLRLTAGRPDLALEVLDATLKEAAPGAAPSVSGLLLRAEILNALERPGEARAVYEEVRQREPRSPVALGGIGRSLLDEGRPGDARDFLRTAIPQVPANPQLFLLLAEAESALGNKPGAIEAVKHGVDTIPKSAALWVRLGELYIASDAWTDASNAFAHAIALEPKQVVIHLRAGFVAEKLGHPNEALALYEHATQVDPTNKFAWSSRGLALLAIGRPEEARQSFDRALALDSDFEAAKEGKKAAAQKTRQGQIEHFGREALLLEARLNRSVTKNDLFVSLHVPYEFLEPVLTAIGRSTKIDIDHLSESELRDLETSSYHLISAALERRPPGIERRGFTLADVAVLSPPNLTLDQTQRLFGYLQAVLEADFRPENLQLTPDVEELARKALLLPPEQRTLFQLVRGLRVGVFKARLIKVVEEAGSAVHAPLPSLDLGEYSPEFRGGEDEAPTDHPAYVAPEESRTASAGSVGAGANEPMATPNWSTVPTATAPEAAGPAHGTTAPAGARCVGCGGIASLVHACGAPLCQHCIGRFQTCPKCGQAVTSVSSRPVDGVTMTPSRPAHTTRPGNLSIKSVFQRSKTGGRSDAPAPAHAERTHPSAPATGRARSTKESTPAAPAAPPEPPEEAPAPPRPPQPREKKDEEPRL
jgi:tetratricopeptide (TPR) repeat protein